MRVKPGSRGRASIVVDGSQTAAAVGSGLVATFSTPSLITLMEAAAIDAITPYLDEGETSVGSEVSIKHLAATPPGFRVRAEAVVMDVEERRISFSVVAFDDREKVGEGAHVRYVIDLARFMERVRRKASEEGTV